MVVLAALVHPPLARTLLVPFGAMALVTAAAARWSLRRAQSAAPSTGPDVALRNPFSLIAAVKFGLLFAVVLLLVTLVQQRFPGRRHLRRRGARRLERRRRDHALDGDARAQRRCGLAHGRRGSIVVAVLANTLVKCALSATLGGARLRRSALLLTLLLVAIGLAALAVL